MTAHKVTQADRKAYHSVRFIECSNEPFWSQNEGREILAGDHDRTPQIQAFAAHRIAAEKSRDDVIEECAKVAEGHRYDDPLLDVCGMRREHRHDLAQAIRAMKGSKT